MKGLQVYLVSGGSGWTGQQVLRASLAQFPNNTVQVELKCAIRTLDEVETIVSNAAEAKGVICHTLVAPDLRRAITASALNAGLPCVDLLGPTLALLADHLEVQPVGRAGLLYEVHKDQLDRIDAVDFTLAHDDGHRLHELDQADVVLVGLSRVSKSVTSFYLASRGIRAANVPIVETESLPEELLKLDPNRVFGLTMNASHLASIRRARLDRIAGRHEVPDYADLRQLNREIQRVDSEFARHGWTRIDVSYKATEEVAALIIDSLKKRHLLSDTHNSSRAGSLASGHRNTADSIRARTPWAFR
jgi:[pyruvate, water dikinase]-phosphate phosphotransferase / [pyruvate, water dikinase] kinase